MTHFWDRLPRPILALAPMEDVTDTVFRQTVAKYGKPDVFFTEFVNVDGMFSLGQEKVRERLKYTDSEHPLVAQIWGLNPENFYKAGKEIVELGFDGIDLNFGCPEKKVVRKGACIALINNRRLASEIIQATRESIASRIPISIKTRIGLEKIVTEEWVEFLLSHGLEALIVHGRTAKNESKVPANWGEIGKAVEVRNKMKLKTLIIGNGDIVSRKQALQKVAETHVDGVMIGRGIFRNLRLFADQDNLQEFTIQERLDLCLFHIRLFEYTWKSIKPFHHLKKYFKIYVQGFPGASKLREQLMQTKSASVAEEVLKKRLTS